MYELTAEQLTLRRKKYHKLLRCYAQQHYGGAVQVFSYPLTFAHLAPAPPSAAPAGVQVP